MYHTKIINRIIFNSYQKNIEQAVSSFWKVLAYQNQLLLEKDHSSNSIYILNFDQQKITNTWMIMASTFSRKLFLFVSLSSRFQSVNYAQNKFSQYECKSCDDYQHSFFSPAEYRSCKNCSISEPHAAPTEFVYTSQPESLIFIWICPFASLINWFFIEAYYFLMQWIGSGNGSLFLKIKRS